MRGRVPARNKKNKPDRQKFKNPGLYKMSQFDINNFANVTIPLILSYRNDYYIKGGRAYDVYFKDSQPSADWDVVGSRHFFEYLHGKLSKIAEDFGIKLSVYETRNPTTDKPMVQMGFEGHEMEADDPYILDVVISESIHYDEICDLNYMPLLDFVKDLLITYENRADQTRDYLSSLGEEGPLLKYAKKFNETYGTEFDINKSFEENRDQIVYFLREYSDRLFPERIREIINRGIIIPLETAKDPSYEEVDGILKADLSEGVASEEDEEKLWEFERFLVEDFAEIIAGSFLLERNKREYFQRSQKLRKTSRRFNNVINITWENLTCQYKIWLIKNCDRGAGDYLPLFDIDPTCRATLSCVQKKISRNTSGCLGPGAKNKIDIIEGKFK